MKTNSHTNPCVFPRRESLGCGEQWERRYCKIVIPIIFFWGKMIQKIKWSSTRICFKTSLGLPTAHIRLQNDDLTIWSYMWFPNFAGILRGTRAHPILRRRSIHTYMYIYIYNPLYIARVFPKNRWYMYIHILIHQHIYIYIYLFMYICIWI